MCALDAAEITAVSFLGEVGEEAHHAPSKMSAAKAIAGGERSALLFATESPPQEYSAAGRAADSTSRASSVFVRARRVLVSKDAKGDAGLGGTPAWWRALRRARAGHPKDGEKKSCFPKPAPLTGINLVEQRFLLAAFCSDPLRVSLDRR